MKAAVLLFYILSVLSVSAQTFKSGKLEAAAEVLGITGHVSSLEPAQTASLTAKDGMPIVVRTDSTRAICHIGAPLFHPDMRALIPSPVYDFLEYAVLNWKYKINPNNLYLSKVTFQKGSWDSLLANHLPECDCTITNQDDRQYIVSWKKDDRDIAIVAMPIDYELLVNDTRRNIERDFLAGLARHQAPSFNHSPSRVSEEALKIYGTEGLFVLEGPSYLLPELSQNLYYQLKTVYETVDTLLYGRPQTLTFEAVVPAIVLDQDFPAESLANLLLSAGGTTPDARLKINVHLSDYHQQQLDLPLSQLQDYCRHEGCTFYFASKGTTDGITHGTLFATNHDKGYNHLFSVKTPVTQLTALQPEIQVEAYLFIPPIEKSKLFGKTPTKKSGAKIY